MTKRLLLCLLALGIMPVAAGANQLVNGNFDDGWSHGYWDGPPPGWLGWGTNGWQAPDAGYHFGNFSSTMWWNDTGLVQVFPASPGEQFTMTGKMIHPDAEPLATGFTGVLRFEFWDGPGGWGVDNMLLGVDVGVITENDAVDTWFDYSQSEIAPLDTTEVRVLLMGRDGTGPAQGKFYADELTFIPEPTTMGLLGLGGLSLVRRRRK